MKVIFLECDDTEQIKIIYNKKNTEEINHIKKLINNYSHRITGFDEENCARYIRIYDIYYIEIVDSKCFINTEDNTYKSPVMFKEMTSLLMPCDFVMCSKSTMVNMEHVIGCEIYSECRRLIRLDNGEQLIVNRKYRDAFDERFLNKKKRS